MSISQTCIEQHEKESKAVKKFLIYCFSASIFAHIIGIISLPYLFKEKQFVEADEPIEIIVIDEPEQKQPPTPEPEEIPVLEQPQPVAQIPQDTQTELIESPEQPPVIKPEITNSEPIVEPQLESPVTEPETPIEPIPEPSEKPPEIKPEIPKEVEEENKENAPENPIKETLKPENPTPTPEIADNNDKPQPVISGESPSEDNTDSIQNNQRTPTVEKPVNQGSGNSNENPKVTVDRGNSNNQASTPSNRRRKPITRSIQPSPKPKPPTPPKTTQGGGKCIRNCGLSSANSYVKRNFDGKERRVVIVVTYKENGKVSNVQISPSTGNSSYDRVLRREAFRLRFSKGKSGTLRFGFSIVKPGSQKQREAQERQREQERRRREAEERKRREEEAKKKRKINL